MHVAPGAHDVSLQSTISFSQFLPVNLETKLQIQILVSLDPIEKLGFKLTLVDKCMCILVLCRCTSHRFYIDQLRKHRIHIDIQFQCNLLGMYSSNQSQSLGMYRHAYMDHQRNVQVQPMNSHTKIVHENLIRKISFC